MRPSLQNGDPNSAPSADALFEQPLGLAQWFEGWLEGRLFQPTLIEDEATGQRRGATDEERAAMWAEIRGGN